MTSFESFASVPLTDAGDRLIVDSLHDSHLARRPDRGPDRTGPAIAELVRRWESQPSQREEKRPVTVQSPLVVGGAIVFGTTRDFALDVNSGASCGNTLRRTRWFGPFSRPMRSARRPKMPRLPRRRAMG